MKKPIMMAYYRTWRDAMIPDRDENGVNRNEIKMTDLPHDIDIVSVFHAIESDEDVTPFFEELKNNYVPTLHARGQKLVRTLDYSVLLEVKGDKKLEEITKEDYRNFAQGLIDEYMTPWNLDGLDVDMETELNKEQEEILKNVIIELSDLLDIQNSDEKLLIYDTNKDNHPLFPQIAPYISYLFIQAYGRPVERLDTTWETYKGDIAPEKTLFGISFYEERDKNNWRDASGPYEESRAYHYAKWQPEEGQKGGLFVYAIDRDGKKDGDDTITMTDFSWTKKLIETINEFAK